MRSPNTLKPYGELGINLNMNKSRIKFIYIGLVALLCGLLVLSVILAKREDNISNYINQLRIDSNNIYEIILDKWPLDDDEIRQIEHKNQKEHKISYTIITIDEALIYSNSNTIDFTSEKLLMRELYMDSGYQLAYADTYKLSQPIYISESIVGFVIFEKIYDGEIKDNNLTKKTIDIMIAIVIIILLVMLGFQLFSTKKSELITIEQGLKNITIGKLDPIAINKNSDYLHIYHTYNTLVEELGYILKQQEYDEGQRKAFLTMISHELKTPISIINAYVEGLSNGIADDDKKKAKYLNIIHEKMQQLSKQVEDFFTYAQERANRLKYTFVEQYADVLIQKIFLNITDGANDKITSENLLPKCLVNVDEIRIEQVVMNLYNNARKHTTEASTILLRAYRQDNEMIIEVIDDGDGISVKDLPHIFDYYYQGEKSQKSDYQGAGIGLAICKEIIESHNGRIKVKSTENQGTTMYVMIPIV